MATDIALRWNSANGHADLVMNASGTDLATDVGLETSVIISLFSDAEAPDGIAIPDGTPNRRGYWGDMPIDPADAAAVPTGSTLWLYENGLQTDATRRAIELAAQDSLKWMITNDLASAVTASASFPSRGRCDLIVDIEQAAGKKSLQFGNIWGNT